MRPHLHAIAAISLAALVGAEAAAQQAEPEAAPTRLPVQRAQAVQAVPLRDFQELRVVQAERTTPGDPNLAEIDWAAAQADRQRQLAAYRQQSLTAVTAAPPPFAPPLSAASQERLRPVRLPVLLPQIGGPVTTRQGGDPGVMLITRAHFYDASFAVPGMSVHVSGTAIIRHRVTDAGMAATLDAGRGADGVRVSRDEGGYTADFSRYGAAYTLSIECASRTDRRCADETAVRALVDRLVVAGGNPEE